MTILFFSAAGCGAELQRFDFDFDLGFRLRGCGGGKPPRCWGCGWGWGWVWPQGFGRGARPWGGLRGCPPAGGLQHRRVWRGETTRPCPPHINFFLQGGYGGAWSGAQAEERPARFPARRLGAFGRRGAAAFSRPRPGPDCGHVAAGRTCRSRSGTERAGVPGKKKNMVFTLSWTVRAKRAPWVRCGVRWQRDSNLTSSIQTRRIAALTIRRAGAAGRSAGSQGIRKLPLHGAGRGRFRGRRRAPRCGVGAGPHEPSPNLLSLA